MIIKFDYGTKGPIDMLQVHGTLDSIVDMHKKSGLIPGKLIVYLTSFDEDGLQKEFGFEDGTEIGYLVRKNKYSKVPQNTSFVRELNVVDEETGEVLRTAYLYMVLK